MNGLINSALAGNGISGSTPARIAATPRVLDGTKGAAEQHEREQRVEEAQFGADIQPAEEKDHADQHRQQDDDVAHGRDRGVSRGTRRPRQPRRPPYTPKSSRAVRSPRRGWRTVRPVRRPRPAPEVLPDESVVHDPREDGGPDPRSAAATAPTTAPTRAPATARTAPRPVCSCSPLGSPRIEGSGPASSRRISIEAFTQPEALRPVARSPRSPSRGMIIVCDRENPSISPTLSNISSRRLSVSVATTLSITSPPPGGQVDLANAADLAEPFECVLLAPLFVRPGGRRRR